MRPPAREKLGYYPTPLKVVELLSGWFIPSEEPGRLLDPCAGEGTAVQLLGEALNCSTWGTELSYRRAKVASEKVDILLDAAWEHCTLTDESISFLFLNPPYDNYGVAHGGRLEMGFLRSTTCKLIKGGVLAFLIPDYVYQRKEVYGFLHTHYDIQLVRRFSKGEYAAFKQLVIVGIRRELPVPKVNMPLFGSDYDPGELTVAGDMDKIPLLPAPLKGKGGRSILFRRKSYPPQELVQAARTHGVQSWRPCLRARTRRICRRVRSWCETADSLISTISANVPTFVSPSSNAAMMRTRLVSLNALKKSANCRVFYLLISAYMLMYADIIP